MAGCAHGVHAGVCGATRYGSAEQTRLTELLKRSLPKEVADALFKYEGFLDDLGCMSLTQCVTLCHRKQEELARPKREKNSNWKS